MTHTKIHLTRGDRRTACGILIRRASRPDLPVTTDVAKVTCRSCASSLAMAHAEIEQQRRPRR